MLIIKYLLLASYFLTQVAVLAAPIPSDAGPSTPSLPIMQQFMYPITPAPSTNPPRKRSQISIACGNCRKSGKKCDGGTPQCGECVRRLRSGVDLGVCVYTPRKPSNQTGKKRGPYNKKSVSLLLRRLLSPSWRVEWLESSLNFLTSRSQNGWTLRSVCESLTGGRHVSALRSSAPKPTAYGSHPWTWSSWRWIHHE